jgi:hypothetical protein
MRKPNFCFYSIFFLILIHYGKTRYCVLAHSFLYPQEYEKKSKRSDEYIRVILEQGIMGEAVAQCVAAAGEEYESKLQKELLRAASFGKCFDMGIDSSDFVSVCQNLRILHSIRHDSQIAVPLSFSQLKQLSVPVLTDRLVLRRQYGLALKICQYLKMSDLAGASRILAHWARFKVLQHNIRDDQIADAIVNKIKDTAGISYAHIAEEVSDSKFVNLGIQSNEIHYTIVNCHCIVVMTPCRRPFLDRE